jgi:hypothetical protein
MQVAAKLPVFLRLSLKEEHPLSLPIFFMMHHLGEMERIGEQMFVGSYHM